MNHSLPGATLQPGHAKQVDDTNPQAVVQTIFAFTSFALTMMRLHQLHSAAGTQRQGRQETVHMVKLRQFGESLTPDQYQSAAGIRRFVLQHAATHETGDPG